MFIGSGGRFSTNLDFTRLEEHDHEEIILDMMGAFEHPFHGIQFSIRDDGYYQTQDGLSWGVNPTYAHSWNPGGQSEIRLQVSRREFPTLPLSRNAQCPQNYFRHLPFTPIDITCLALPEIITEKIRACYQRSKARDIYDLSVFATRPLDQRSFAGLSCSNSGRRTTRSFLKHSWLGKFADINDFDWEDLRQLVRQTQAIQPDRITAACLQGYAFLAELDPAERVLADDLHQRDHATWRMLRNNLPTSRT